MIDDEYRQKREKGLCYKCDEKCSTGHRCKGRDFRELRVLLVRYFDEIFLEYKDYDDKHAEYNRIEPEEPPPTIGEQKEQPQLSLKFVLGFSSPNTMKVEGEIENHPLIVLIDCGSTDNFIAQGLVDELQLPLTSTSYYDIVMGNGVTINGKRVCKAVMIKLPELTVKDDFLSMEFGSVEVILRMQWLQRQGHMTVD